MGCIPGKMSTIGAAQWEATHYGFRQIDKEQSLNYIPSLKTSNPIFPILSFNLHLHLEGIKNEMPKMPFCKPLCCIKNTVRATKNK